MFFLQARTLGEAAFWTPAAGYYHTLLRMVAWLAARVDVALTPACYVGAAGLFTLYVAARTQSSRFPLGPSPLFALAVVLIPDGYEVLLNLTNVQWILAGGLILLLIAAEPQSTCQRFHDVIALVLLGLTGPFVLVFAPLFIWRAARRQTRFSVLLALLALGCAGIQLSAVLAAGGAATVQSVNAALLLAIPGARVGGSLFAGGQLDAGAPIQASMLAGGAVIALLGILALRPGPSRLQRIWLGCAFIGLGGAGLFRCRELLPQLLEPGLGGRYFFPLQLIMAWLLVAAYLEGGLAVRRLARVGLLMVGLTNAGRMQEPALPDTDWPAYAAQIRDGAEVIVSTNPANWEFTVPGKHSTNDPNRRQSLPSGGLVNAATRAWVTPERPAMLTFVVRGSRPRKMLVRAVGPSLVNFGVHQPLVRPSLRLQRNGETVGGVHPLRHNVADGEILDATERCGAFGLRPEAGDLVALLDLTAGPYSAVVSTDGETGEVLLEVYEVPHCWYPRARRLNKRTE